MAPSDHPNARFTRPELEAMVWAWVLGKLSATTPTTWAAQCGIVPADDAELADLGRALAAAEAQVYEHSIAADQAARGTLGMLSRQLATPNWP